jgi:HEPN domain-containing protein
VSIQIDDELRRMLQERAQKWFREVRKRGRTRRRMQFQEELRLLSQPQTPDEIAAALQRTFLSELPQMVRRSAAIRTTILSGASHARVGRFVIEATRAFIRGDFNSTIIVCRSAVDGALKQKLVRPNRAVKHRALASLINLAVSEGKLTRRLGRKAHKVRRRGNRYVHARRMSRKVEKEAEEILNDTKTLLEHLFPH